jgi:hypothetical protein
MNLGQGAALAPLPAGPPLAHDPLSSPLRACLLDHGWETGPISVRRPVESFDHRAVDRLLPPNDSSVRTAAGATACLHGPSLK